MTTMISEMTIPDEAPEQLARSFGVAPGAIIGLVWSLDHPDSHYGSGVMLLSGSDTLIDGASFRVLRDSLGARILTTHPRRVALALGVPWQADYREPGIETGHALSIFACQED